MREGTLLSVESLSKSFAGLKAVDNVTFEIDSGGIISIIGPNGAGKSTLVNVLTGLLNPDSGRIVFNSENITHKPIYVRVRKGLSRSFQINSLFSNMTVKENILLSLLYWYLPGRSILKNILPRDVERVALEIMESIGMKDKMNVDVDKLSHGEQRLVEITLAVAKTPKLLFLDEPTSGLSPAEREIIIEKIKSIADSGTTVVLIEHNMDVVFSLARRIIVLNRGRIIADDSPDGIRNNEHVRSIYLGEDLTVA